MLIETNGIWTIAEDEYIGKWVRETGRLDHDQWLIDRLWERGVSGRVCLDIGAYIGDHTAFYAKWFEQVLAFEPNPEAFTCLVRNMKDTEVECYNFAVGTADEGLLAGGERNPGAMHILPAPGPVRFIKDLDMDEVDFIKIDVEGMEPDVIRACWKTITECEPRMLIEQRQGDGNEDKVFAMLEALGYDYEPIQGDYHEQYDLWCEKR